MDWVMMAAGSGTRFGPGVPKPFRRVRDKPMYEHVAIEQGVENFRLVLRQGHEEFMWKQEQPDRVRDVQFIPDTANLGPAYSALFGTLDYTSYRPVVFVDCDCFFKMPTQDLYDSVENVIGRNWSLARDRRHAAGVVTTRCAADNKGLSYLDTERVLVEGGAWAGDEVNIGVYFWSSIHTFRQSLCAAQRALSLRTKELKMSDVFNCTEGRCGLELRGEFVNLGTPEELQVYLDKQ